MIEMVLPPPIVIVAGPRASSPRAFTRQSPEGTWSVVPRPLGLVLPFGPFAEQDAIAELRVASRVWGEIPCTSLRFTVDGVASIAPTSGDGVSHVVFHSSDWPTSLVPRALAQTVVVVDGKGALTDADVHVNGMDHVYSLDGRPGTVDLRSILTHELGHALGLGHSTVVEATMAAAASGTRFRSLESDDEAGACTLYPGKGSALCPDVPCPSGFVCAAGTCERPRTDRTTCAPCVRELGACDNAGTEGRCIDLQDGRVCARACDQNHPCGAGFSCTRTSEAGDQQCLADDGCRALGTPCSSDATCGEHVCRSGRCVGRVEPAARDAGPPDAGPPEMANASNEGCGTSPSPARGAFTLVWALVLLVVRTRSRNASR